eukprot:CAMPEP_0170182632 /NCGR_PEP_ID=MMETSP0040_2-20121228/28423_1 /TAXON_ID=641309 /ORGANISM="Lotharella oceanica, Strain CCMP622" /LENGTH=66 /DNA_ID=CAMNT_0010428117 /DNA_START=292 /DNA_END=492 /DNA_ORIENTATION=+
MRALAPVSSQVIPRRELRVAVWALDRLFLRVLSAHVASESGLLCEPLGTEGARIWLLARVQADVFL